MSWLVFATASSPPFSAAVSVASALVSWGVVSAPSSEVRLAPLTGAITSPVSAAVSVPRAGMS